jgi:cation transport regulator ChaC
MSRWLVMRAERDTEGAMGETWVFAYGSNMNLADLGRWLQCRHQRGQLSRDDMQQVLGVLNACGKRAVLEGWRVCWNYCSRKRGGGAANVEQAAGERVFGVAYRVGERELRLFDCKEGHPRYYKREEKQPVLLLDSQKEVTACVYVANATCPEPVWPTPEYKAILVEGARHWGLPPGYIAELESIPTKG